MRQVQGVVVILVLSIGLCLSRGTWAEDGFSHTDAIEMDTGQVTQTAKTVGFLNLQLESGARFVADDFQNLIKTRTYDFPTMLRIGVLDSLEARLSTNGPTVVDLVKYGGSKTGMSDFDFSLKYHIFGSGDTVPAISIIPFVKAPVGADGYRAKHFQYGMTAATEVDIWRFNVAANLGVTRAVEDGTQNWAQSVKQFVVTHGTAVKDLGFQKYAEKQFTQMQASVMLGFRVTERFSLYGEAIRWQPTEHTTNDMAFGGGLKYLFSRNLVMNVGGRASGTKRAPDATAYLSFGLRFGLGKK